MLVGYMRVSSDGDRLGFEHINMLGRYPFTLPDAVAHGELRPLRNPAAQGTDADEPALT